MAGEEKIYTKGEMQLLLATKEIETVQKTMLKSFNAHLKDNEEHFTRLYKDDKIILEKVELIPQKLVDCADRMKKDILNVAVEKYTPLTDFKVFRTQMITGIVVGTMLGSALATIASLLISAYK